MTRNNDAGDLMDELFGPIPTATNSTAARVDDDNDDMDQQHVISKSRLLPEVELSDPFAKLVGADAGSLPAESFANRLAESTGSRPQLSANDYYVVNGLSERVPSDEYRRNAAEQAQLRAQLAAIEMNREQWCNYDQYVETALERTSRATRARAAECYRRLAAQFVPQPTVLKPASESRRLNDEWKALLRAVVSDVTQRYRDATRNALAENSVLGGVDIDTEVEQYMERNVYPALLTQLETISRSNYDERPLLFSQLRRYFDAYLDDALAYLSVPAGAASLPVPDTEQQRVSCYMASVLETYAMPVMRDQWLPNWLTRRRAIQPVPAAIEASLRRYITRIVEYREAQRSQQSMPYFFEFYVPMTEEDVRAAYRTMLDNEVALQRARAVLDVDALRRSLQEHLTNEFSRFPTPSDFIAHPVYGFYTLLDTLVAEQRTNIERAYKPLATATAAEVTALGARELVATRALSERIALVVDAYTKYGNPRTRVVQPHAPSDGLDVTTATPADVKWSPHDLTYPLDVNSSRVAIARLRVVVARTAENFDADTQQARAHEIRRALDHNYTMQLLERRRAELHYLLEKMTDRLTDVPQRVVRNFLDASGPQRLLINIALAPRLERRVLGTNQTLLDPNDLLAQERLYNSKFLVRWYHKPTATGNEVPRETLMREVTLPEGHLTDVLSLFTDAEQPTTGGSDEQTLAALRGALRFAGIYRVEVRRVGDLDVPPPVYHSRFQATLVVVARCARDDVEFTPLWNGAGVERAVCCWQEQPANAEHIEYVEELRALVEHGPQAHKQLLESRANSGIQWLTDSWIKEAAQRGVAFPLPLPPWGNSSPDHLVQTSYESDSTLMQRFEYTTIYEKLRARVAAVLRIIALQNPMAGFAGLPVLLSDAMFDDITLFNAALDLSAGSINVVDVWRRAAAEYGFNPTTFGLTQRSVISTIMVKRTRKLLELLIGFLPDHNPSTVPSSTSSSVQYDAPAGYNLSRETMLAQLQRVAHPFSQLLMTERERAFFGQVARQFTSFTQIYREYRGQLLYWTTAEMRMPEGPTGGGELTNFSRLLPSVQRELDAEVDALTPAQVRREMLVNRDLYTSVARMFTDDVSFNEYKRLIGNCARINKFSDKMRARERMFARGEQPLVGDIADMHAYFHCDTNYENACGVDTITSMPAIVPTWSGAHSAIDNQPQPMVIQYTGTLGAGAANISARAQLLHAGSQPTNKNIDFNGLRQLVEHACQTYTDTLSEMAARRPAVAAADLAATAKTLATQAERLALVFNYFAFAAPTLPYFADARRLLEDISSGRVFGRLSFELPL